VVSEREIKQRFSSLEAWLDERSRRLWAAAESAAHGRVSGPVRKRCQFSRWTPEPMKLGGRRGRGRNSIAVSKILQTTPWL
jgi:hypothetical protein